MSDGKLNGVAALGPPSFEELRDYAMAYVDLTSGYIGRPIDGDDTGGHGGGTWVTLRPAWVFFGGYNMQGDPRTGQMNVGRQLAVLPIEMWCDVHEKRTRYLSLERLSAMSEGDFHALGKQLVGMLAQASQLRENLRAQRSGLVMAMPGVKLPPPPGPGPR